MTENTVSNRRTVALTESTIAQIKQFSQQHKLKMYLAIQALFEIALSNPEIVAQVVKRAKELNNEALESKTTLGKLPKEVREKLKKLTPDQIAAALSNL